MSSSSATTAQARAAVPSALDQRAESQRKLLGLLLQHREGLTVSNLVRQLGITENAVREHLAALEQDGFVDFKVMPASRGRPKHVYRLTAQGREAFPRRYSDLALSLMDELGDLLSESQLKAVMRRSGARAAKSLSAEALSVPATARAMKHLGYEASSRKDANGADEIVAMNCVFHRLAERSQAVCEFDLAFMKAATGRAVQHRECMVRGGQCCRFGFEPKDQ